MKIEIRVEMRTEIDMFMCSLDLTPNFEKSDIYYSYSKTLTN